MTQHPAAGAIDGQGAIPRGEDWLRSSGYGDLSPSHRRESTQTSDAVASTLPDIPAIES